MFSLVNFNYHSNLVLSYNNNFKRDFDNHLLEEVELLPRKQQARFS